MPTDLSASLPLILLGLVGLVLAVWVLSRLNRKARVITDDSAPALVRDVLDDGAERAQRNQALIDAAPAAVKAAPAATPAPAPEPAPAEPEAIAEAATEAEPEPAAAPAPEAEPAPTDDLARIKGVGPKLVTLLGELGITSTAQVAAWTEQDVERIDAQLGRFKGRITRDQWIAQAQLLAAGDEAAFIARFGKNG